MAGKKIIEEGVDLGKRKLFQMLAPKEAPPVANPQAVVETPQLPTLTEGGLGQAGRSVLEAEPSRREFLEGMRNAAAAASIPGRVGLAEKLVGGLGQASAPPAINPVLSLIEEILKRPGLKPYFMTSMMDEGEGPIRHLDRFLEKKLSGDDLDDARSFLTTYQQDRLRLDPFGDGLGYSSPKESFRTLFDYRTNDNPLEVVPQDEFMLLKHAGKNYTGDDYVNLVKKHDPELVDAFKEMESQGAEYMDYNLSNFGGKIGHETFEDLLSSTPIEDWPPEVVNLVKTRGLSKDAFDRLADEHLMQYDEPLPNWVKVRDE